jgi:putative Holliday junction resolvase
VRLGVDPGRVRVGVAASDPEGRLATPVTTLQRRSSTAALRRLAEERSAIEVVVGRPRSLSGAAGPAEREVMGYARELAAALDPCPVRLIDERLSTVQATAGLRAAGVTGPVARGRVDAAAAAVILQAALDEERATGRPPGESVTDP